MRKMIPVENMNELGQIPNKKNMRIAMMPQVGSRLGPYLIVYVHDGKFQFTAEGSPLPTVGSAIESDGHIYEIIRVDENKSRFNGVFRGFKQNPVIDAPIDEDETLTKVI